MLDFVYLILTVLMISHYLWLRKLDKEYIKLGSWSNHERFNREQTIDKQMENEKSREEKILMEHKQLEDRKHTLETEINKLEGWIKENTFKE